MNLQGWVAGLNRSSSFDYCREFNTASNAEMYLDCVKQEAIRDCLGRVRSGISNPKVHYSRYASGDVLPDNDCPFCPEFEDNELHLFLVCKTYERIRPDKLKNIESRYGRNEFIR